MKAWWLLSCLAFAACAGPESRAWLRSDGSAASPEQLELDQMACRSQMQDATAATTRAAGLDRGPAETDAYSGCMTQRGYVTNAPACRQGLTDARVWLMPCP